LKLIISALSLFAASSKELLVLVLGSKNRLMMVFPLSMGTFFTSRVEISRERFGRIQNQNDILFGQGLDAQKMLVIERHGFLLF
jgi:hypothetical protein